MKKDLQQANVVQKAVIIGVDDDECVAGGSSLNAGVMNVIQPDLRVLYGDDSSPGGPKVRPRGFQKPAYFKVFRCRFWCRFVPEFGAILCDSVRSLLASS
jgi:hypothetical protein